MRGVRHDSEKKQMNTDALKTFLVLSELRSFRKTAQQLYIAQSTVSSRIQELERDLGQTLFDRKPRGMTLTPAGHRLIPIARRIVDLEKDLREEAVSKTVWQLNLGISDSIYYGCVDTFLPEFVYNYPDISLTVVSKSSSDMVNMLRDNELDLCVSFLPGSDPGLDTVVLSEDEIVLATTINNREYVSGIALGELWDQTLFYSECFSISRELGRWRSAVLPDNLSFRVTMPVIYQLGTVLERTDGYAFVPRPYIREQLEHHTLHTVPLLFEAPPPIYTYAAAKKSQMQSYRIRAFLTELRNHVSGKPHAT